MPLTSSTATSDHATSAQDGRADAALAARARGGDAAAFELVMRRHNRLLFRTARGIVADDAEAQDVVQETYLRAFMRLESFRGDAALATWLARIAVNVALDAQRRKGRQVALDEQGDLAAEPLPEHMMSFCAPQSENPDAAAERGQLRALLQLAIERLPPIYRSVFILRAVEEMSVDQTAFCLQVSEDVVKTRYLRARSLLRDALGAQIEAHASQVFSFDGARCDAVVNHVMTALRQQGLIRPC
jgi:RNA polymerase sigma-70 factor (ECF subfamily)